MRQALFLTLLFLSATAWANRDEDEAAIRKILQEQEIAWNAGDAKAYSKHVSKAVAFTNVFGVVGYGSATFEKRHHGTFNTIYKGTTKITRIRQLRFATPDVVIVDIDNEIHGVKQAPPGLNVTPQGVVHTQLMQVFVRHAGQWWVEAYHNVDVKPASPANPPGHSSAAPPAGTR